MAKLYVDTIEPEGATTNLAIGESGQDVIVTGNDIRANTVQDAGGGATADVYAAFTSTGASTWTCPAGVTSADILVVGGGGGGGDPGAGAGGAGGGGGVVHHATYTVVPAVVYDITVGTGGAFGSGGSPQGVNGVNSVFNVNAEGSQATMTALGGAGGGAYNADAEDGGSGGGAGGGDADGAGTGTQANSAGGTGYGNDGGDGYGSSSGDSMGAGGGGSAAVGDTAVSNNAGDGGAGQLFSNFTSYGQSGYFSGGGGGGAKVNNSYAGSGGIGGGGAGTYEDTASTGTANTGGGGGSAGSIGTSAAGGTGVVLIRYNTGAADPTTLWVSNGSGVLSSVNSGFGDALKLISSQTFTDQATVSITSGIDSTYKEYIFKFYEINQATDQYLTINFSSDGGSNYNMTKTTTYFEAYHYESDASGLIYQAGWDLAESTAGQPISQHTGAEADECMAGELHLYNPASTTYVKNFYSKANNYAGANIAQNPYVGGFVNSTTAINAVQFAMSSGNFDGTIMMYGVK